MFQDFIHIHRFYFYLHTQALSYLHIKALFYSYLHIKALFYSHTQTLFYWDIQAQFLDICTYKIGNLKVM